MGYYTHTVESDVRIPKSGFAAICKHLLDTGFDDVSVSHRMMGGGSYSPGVEGKTAAWYSWVDMEKLTAALKDGDLLGVFQLFSFETPCDEEGNLIALCYDCKTGDEEALLKAISPFMEDRCYVRFEGEDGTHYRYHWRNQELHYTEGRVEFPPM